MINRLRLMDEIEKFYSDERDLPVLQPVTPAEVRAALESRYTFEVPVPLETLTADVMPDAARLEHPGDAPQVLRPV